MNETMLNLGGFLFQLTTAAYTNWQRATEYRWATNDRIGERPSHQYIGPGADSITLSGTIYPLFNPGDSPRFRGGRQSQPGTQQLERLRVMAGKGVPLMVVDGRGRVFGLFVVLRINETATVFFSDGTPQKQEFTIELERYGGSAEAARAQAGQALGSVVYNEAGA